MFRRIIAPYDRLGHYSSISCFYFYRSRQILEGLILLNCISCRKFCFYADKHIITDLGCLTQRIQCIYFQGSTLYYYFDIMICKTQTTIAVRLITTCSCCGRNILRYKVVIYIDIQLRPGVVRSNNCKSRTMDREAYCCTASA